MFDIETIRKLLCYIRNMSATLLRTLMLEITCSIHQEINFFLPFLKFCLIPRIYMCQLVPVEKSQCWICCFLAKIFVSDTCSLRITAETVEAQVGLKEQRRKLPSRWTDSVRLSSGCWKHWSGLNIQRAVMELSS